MSSFASVHGLSHLASYNLVPKVYFDNFELDIDINASWQDHIPLSYFAQYVSDIKGNKYYDLDFIQFNINYPAPSKFKEDETSGEKVTYQIVGEDEADLKLGLINISSPIARALIGKEEGDVAVVVAPGGEKSYEVVAVHYR